MKLRSQTGDTIVEVLISLAVLGLIIGTAYAIANRSLTSAQQSQERTQALKIAEGQVDIIKYLSESVNENDADTFADLKLATTESKCLATGEDEEENEIIIAFDSSSAECTSDNGIFNTAILYNSQQHLFDVSVNWTGLGDAGDQNVTIQYRVVQ